MRLSGMSGSDLRRLGLGAAAARPAGRPAGRRQRRAGEWLARFPDRCARLRADSAARVGIGRKERRKERRARGQGRSV